MTGKYRNGDLSRKEKAHSSSDVASLIPTPQETVTPHVFVAPQASYRPTEQSQKDFPESINSGFQAA